MPTNQGFFSNFFGGGGQSGQPNGGQPSGQGGQPNGQAPAEPASGGQQAPQQFDSSGQPTGQPSGAPAANGDQGGQPGQTGQGAQENPLDIYNKMFENQSTGEEDAPPSLTLGKDTLEKVTGQLDFTSGIDPATIDQLQQGDLSSLPSLLNKVAQQVYSTAMQHNSKLVDEFVKQRSEYDSQQIAPAVKSTLTQSHLDQNLGDLSKQPAMKAQMTETAERLAKAYPDASPEWIAKQSKDYVIQSASQLMGTTPEEIQQLQQQKQQQQQTAQSVDWSTYFD